MLKKLHKYPFWFASIGFLSRFFGFLRNIVAVWLVKDVYILDSFFLSLIPFQLISSLLGASFAVSFLTRLPMKVKEVIPEKDILYKNYLVKMGVESLRDFVKVSLISSGFLYLFYFIVVSLVKGKVSCDYRFAFISLGFFVGFVGAIRVALVGPSQLFGYFLFEPLAVIVYNFSFIVLIIGFYFGPLKYKYSFPMIWIISMLFSLMFMIWQLNAEKKRRNLDIANLERKKYEKPFKDVAYNSIWLAISNLFFLTWIYIDRSFAIKFGEGAVTVIALSSIFYSIIVALVGGTIGAMVHSGFMWDSFKEEIFFQDYVKKTFVWTVWFAGLAIVFSWLVVPIILPHSFPLRQEFVNVLGWYMIFSPLGSFCLLLYRWLNMFQELKVAACIGMLSSFFYFLFVYWLSSFLGLVGIPVGAGMGCLVYVFLALWKIKKVSGGVFKEIMSSFYSKHMAMAGTLILGAIVIMKVPGFKAALYSIIYLCFSILVLHLSGESFKNIITWNIKHPSWGKNAE